MKKQEIITFKVDESLREVMKDIPNRSEFIRHAILQALDNVCPVCQGTGSLSPSQKKHWQDFAKTHPPKRCGHCDVMVLTCSAGEQ